MFTGIIEEVGEVLALNQSEGRLDIQADTVLAGTRLGDSIAVNGVCLTVTRMGSTGFSADVMGETLRRSNLGHLTAGARVNLERAMAADGRFGGHIVSGHIDGTGSIQSTRREGNAVWVRIAAPPEILLLIVEKGSVAIDGISLTVAAVDEVSFQVSIIPHTGEETTLLRRKAGDVVNLENDVIGKYVQKLLSPTVETGRSAESGLSMEFMLENGF